ncbi:MAG: hypothetical protein ACFFDN_09380 [Candidatus Hodarchaeota archaeon]
MQRQLKKKLILFLSKSNCSENISIASTLAWLSESKNYVFDNYYDSYHKGTHFGGGDTRIMETGKLTGGTVSGDRHFEELYFLLLNFDVFPIIFQNSLFSNVITHFNIPVVSRTKQINLLYKKVFNDLDTPIPSNIVMIGSRFDAAISGLEAYLYPEIYYRQAIGVSDSINEDELADLYQDGSKIFCFYVDEGIISRLKQKKFEFEIIDRLKENDDYLSVTKRIALRWEDKIKGWILGDPMLISHWIPKACEENLLSIYSVPQEKIVSKLGDLISSKGNVVYGRQYSDRDFFGLSNLNQCLQVIDPCRPPFQSVKHADFSWHKNQNKQGFYDPEYSDEELVQFAREKRILVSLMFWSGMIREIANFYNLIDLFAITKLRCGLVLTAQSFEYIMHSPLELITIPLDQGGVYPLVEPVLGSCGIGVGIESYIDKNRLQDKLKDALFRISQKVKNENYMPRGWWTTMDTDLEKLPLSKRPKPFRFLKYPPYIQIRYHIKEKKFGERSGTPDKSSLNLIKDNLLDRLKKSILNAGLMKNFEPYRPYESFQASTIKKDIIETAKSVGFKYMFTKAGFNTNPEVKYLISNFIALNYTAGQWDGWTPFETTNDVSDLRKSEKFLLKGKKPGWIVSTIDACLWTFSGEFWKKGSKLFEIAEFCAQGGKSKKLINVKPHTISRYARIIADRNY